MPSKPANSPDKITLVQFSARLKTLIPDLANEPAIAVALSGGGDSMTLTYLLSRWAAKHDVALHALTVDHGLRKEAAAEAKQVGSWVKGWGLTHKILKWTGPKPATRIQEEARAARYRLLESYCQKHGIRYLFLAHHANDQAETILFRFAKGSGIDGLAGMAQLQKLSPHLTLVRPLLEMTHDQLIATCKAAKTPWVEDISNVSDRYARIRLRKSMEILEGEGLSVKRILSIGVRLERAGNALDQLTETAWKNTTDAENTKQVVFIQKALFELPEELVIRLLQKALRQVGAKKTYPPRLESIESLTHDLLKNPQFHAATLGGCVIRRRQKLGQITVERESIKLP